MSAIGAKQSQGADGEMVGAPRDGVTARINAPPSFAKASEGTLRE